MKLISSLSMVVVLAVASISPAMAQFPERDVEFVVSAAAGGGNDTVARQIAARLQEQWGKPVVVLNKPGAAVALAEGYVANAAPDGHTVLFVNQTRTLNAAKGGNAAGYDMVGAFEAVTQIGMQPMIMTANNDQSFKSISELVAYAKANPGKVNYGDSGKGTASDLAMKRFMTLTDTDLFEISYKTHAEVLTALMGGEIDIEFGDVLTLTPHIQAGSITALGVADDERTPVHPDLPTIAEQAGLDSFVYSSWYGVFVPAGTPQEVVDQLHADISAVVNSPEIRDPLVRDGFKVVLNDPASFQTWLDGDAAVWRGVMDAYPQ